MKEALVFQGVLKNAGALRPRREERASSGEREQGGMVPRIRRGSPASETRLRLAQRRRRAKDGWPAGLPS